MHTYFITLYELQRLFCVSEGKKNHERMRTPLLRGKAEYWGFSAWRKGDSGNTLLWAFSTCSVKHGDFLPRPVTEQEITY